MKNSGRAFRRYMKQLRKERARKIWPLDRHAHKYADTMAFCDKICCTNPRRSDTYGGSQMTKQEYSNLLEFLDQIDEIDNNYSLRNAAHKKRFL